MVTLNRIYTRTGDGGTSALGDGERRPKHDLRFAALGTVDETNAAIGVARLHVGLARPDVDAMLHRLQNDLFDLGADLCVPERDASATPALRIVASQVLQIEHDIDKLNASLSPLRSFVLPGGSAASAYLHLARAICRRAERLIVELAGQEGERVNPEAIRFVNRLSDFLFVAARSTNADGEGDVLWVPGQSREVR